MQKQLENEKERYRNLWSLNCAQLAEFDSAISAKVEEIHLLRKELHHSNPPPRRESPYEYHSNSESGETLLSVKSPSLHRGRAPPVEMFSGEDRDNTLDDLVFQHCTLKNGRAWYAKSRVLRQKVDRTIAVSNYAWAQSPFLGLPAAILLSV